MTGGFTSFNAHKYDRAPTRNSDNLLTSGTIYEALQNVSGGGGPVDPEPVEGSENAVSSGGVYDALAGKQDALSRVSVVSALRSTDYLFIERNGSIYRILASAVFTPSEESGDRIESENGEALLTESGDELLLDISEDA